MRRNSIPSLLMNDVKITDHFAKAATLKSFYADLLGTVVPTTCASTSVLSMMLPPLPAYLSTPFSAKEIKDAFLGMNKMSSPGPDGRLSGWQANLLSAGGRLVLCNAVLNNLATYYMCSYLLPRGVIDRIDKRRRAFFWTGKDSRSGARCLVAWDKVMLPT
jgi:hypothetical protein